MKRGLRWVFRILASIGALLWLLGNNSPAIIIVTVGSLIALAAIRQTDKPAHWTPSADREEEWK